MRHWFISTLTLLTLALSSANAYDIDKAYKKPDSLPSIGQVMRSAFNHEGYNKSYALVVGISDFDHFNPLETTEDPLKIKDYLLNEAGFDYVHMLTGSRVTMRRLRNLMVDVLPGKMGPQDRFLFYWSGHGVTDERNRDNVFGHLPLKNSKRDQFSTMLDMDSLSQWDKRLSAKQTLYLLDACFSGYAGIGNMSGRQKKSVKQFGVPSRQVLTAGKKGEETIVLKEKESSVFTIAVLEGLRGKADYYPDNIITANELNTYVRSRVRSLSEQYKWPKLITPSLGRFHNGGEGEFFFLSQKNTLPTTSTSQTASISKPKTNGVSAQSGNSKIQRPNRSPMQHQHNGRAHIHVLPTNVQNHNHDTSQTIQKTNAKPSVKQLAITQRTPRKPFEPEMVDIPAGSFMMGCVLGRDDVIRKCMDDEEPPQKVNIVAFKIGKTEVTFDEWDACTKAGACAIAGDEGWGRGRRPVINISWNDIQTYINWLNQQTGKNYQLPTESQWEYASRGNRNSLFPWGNEINCKIANYGSVSLECKTDRTKVVASYAPNNFGLNDTVGNVREWVQDCWQDSHIEALLNGSARIGCGINAKRVVRDGSWFQDHWFLNSASRSGFLSDRRDNRIGFRLSMSR